MRRFAPLCVAPLCVALLLAATAHPQDLPREEAERPERVQRALRNAAEAAEQSRLLPSQAERDVTWEEVLRAPDDVELNYLFAQTQIRRGDLRGAAATLERILLVNPHLPRVRLLRAVVLYRLDDLVEAEREFRRVAELEMPDSLRREVAAYLEEIEIRQRRTRFGLVSSIGFQWDSNRNAGPRSDEVKILDVRFPVLSDAEETSDFAFLSILQGSVSHDLESQAGHQLFAIVDGYVQKQGDLEELDLLGPTLRAGGVLRTRFATITPSFHAGFLSLDLEMYFKRFGGSVEARRRVGRNAEVALAFRGEHQNYDDLDRAQRVSERTGTRLDAGLGGAYSLGTQHRFDLAARFVYKDASRPWWEYTGVEGLALYTLLLGGGQFVAVGGSYERDWYDEDDPIISTKERRDDRWRAQLSYGAPLRLVLGRNERLGALHDILATVGAQYFRSDSNITNYDYDNWRVSLLFTKRLSF